MRAHIDQLRVTPISRRYFTLGGMIRFAARQFADAKHGVPLLYGNAQVYAVDLLA